MKITSKIIFSLGVASALMWTSCNDDHNADWDEPTPSEVSLVSCSLAEGASLGLEGNVVELVYSSPIALNQNASVTLNNVAISTKPDPATELDSVRVADGNKLIVMLPKLTGNTKYTFHVNPRMVAGIGTMTFAPEVTVNFTSVADHGPVVDPQFGTLVNPNATAQAVKVYNFLIENHGKKILSGAMANVNNNNDFASWIKDKTGKDVAIMGYDFIHLPESGQNWIDYSDISAAESQWAANGLVSYMWHWRVPTDEKAYQDKDFSRYGCRTPGENVEDPTEFDIERALQDGTWENRVILEDLDKAAAVLKQLQEKGIPVIWRPLHEAAGSYKYDGAWFWWGRKGGEATKQLWRLMYDRLVNLHGLNNLIWVWTAQCEEGYYDRMAADYPGNDVVDIIGTDIYAADDASQVAAYNVLLALGEGHKLVTISETGLIQNPDKCFADKAHWSWFNLWYTYNLHQTGGDVDGFGNTAESLKAVFGSPYVINRDQMPSLK